MSGVVRRQVIGVRGPGSRSQLLACAALLAVSAGVLVGGFSQPKVALSGVSDNEQYPLPFPPMCGDGRSASFQGTWKLPAPSGKEVKASITVPVGDCVGASDATASKMVSRLGSLPLAVFHPGFMCPSGWYQQYAELIAGYAGFAVVMHDGGTYVPDSVVATEWLQPLVAWVREQEASGALKGLLPDGVSIDESRLAVVGHSRGGNIAALQMNGTSAVEAGYLMDPVGCGARFAACGGADGDAGVYRAGWTAINAASRRLMMSAADKLSGFNDDECTCPAEKVNAQTGKCPFVYTRCHKVRQSDLFFGAATAPSSKLTLTGTAHWDFLKQPYVNITAASAVAWLAGEVHGEDAARAAALRAFLGDLEKGGKLVIQTK